MCTDVELRKHCPLFGVARSSAGEPRCFAWAPASPQVHRRTIHVDNPATCTWIMSPRGRERKGARLCLSSHVPFHRASGKRRGPQHIHTQCTDHDCMTCTDFRCACAGKSLRRDPDPKPILCTHGAGRGATATIRRRRSTLKRRSHHRGRGSVLAARLVVRVGSAACGAQLVALPAPVQAPTVGRIGRIQVDGIKGGGPTGQGPVVLAALDTASETPRPLSIRTSQLSFASELTPCRSVGPSCSCLCLQRPHASPTSHKRCSTSQSVEEKSCDLLPLLLHGRHARPSAPRAVKLQRSSSTKFMPGWPHPHEPHTRKPLRRLPTCAP